MTSKEGYIKYSLKSYDFTLLELRDFKKAELEWLRKWYYGLNIYPLQKKSEIEE